MVRTTDIRVSSFVWHEQWYVRRLQFPIRDSPNLKWKGSDIFFTRISS